MGTVIGTTSEYPKVKTKYTEVITNEEMAELLVGIMSDLYSDWVIQFSSNFTKNHSKIDLDSVNFSGNWFVKDRLFRWGVFTDTKMKWNGNPTYGEFTNYLIKLVDFDYSLRNGNGYKLTAAEIKKFAIGGNTKSNSKITREQAYILCEKVVDCYRAKNHESLIKDAQKNPNHPVSSRTVGTGVYTITSQLGNKPNLIINNKGQGELNSKKPRNLKSPIWVAKEINLEVGRLNTPYRRWTVNIWLSQVPSKMEVGL